MGEVVSRFAGMDRDGDPHCVALINLLKDPGLIVPVCRCLTAFFPHPCVSGGVVIEFCRLLMLLVHDDIGIDAVLGLLETGRVAFRRLAPWDITWNWGVLLEFARSGDVRVQQGAMGCILELIPRVPGGLRDELDVLQDKLLEALGSGDEGLVRMALGILRCRVSLGSVVVQRSLAGWLSRHGRDAAASVAARVLGILGDGGLGVDSELLEDRVLRLGMSELQFEEREWVVRGCCRLMRRVYHMVSNERAGDFAELAAEWVALGVCFRGGETTRALAELILAMAPDAEELPRVKDAVGPFVRMAIQSCLSSGCACV
jgi:hypothetical protein